MNQIMISQPMNGLTDDKIEHTRNKAIKILKDNGYEVIDSFFKNGLNFDEKEIKCVPVYYLSKAIECMSKCHGVYFAKGWEKARGCKIEHQIAEAYGLKLFYE